MERGAKVACDQGGGCPPPIGHGYYYYYYYYSRYFNPPSSLMHTFSYFYFVEVQDSTRTEDQNNQYFVYQPSASMTALMRLGMLSIKKSRWAWGMLFQALSKIF